MGEKSILAEGHELPRGVLPSSTNGERSILRRGRRERDFPILSSARARTNVILVGKCESHRHSSTNFSENVVVAKTRCYEIYHLAIGRGLPLLQRR